ncbi:MAG: OsmC family protein [Acidobacteria bacterium]|nr:OsmC family protein [Acidobacteriota bacterium]MCZ6663074.1 OsmC family protein [Actinomycetota bacterium]
MRKVSSRWDGGYRCHVKVRQFELKVDEPIEEGGDDTGPRPTEVLLTAVASCFTLAIAHVAKKHSKRLTDLEVEAFGEFDGLRFSRISVMASSGIPRAELQWLADRASRVCYVSNSLSCDFEYSVA